MNQMLQVLQSVIDNVETVMIGKRKTIELVVLSLISKGHVLLEDVPGVGKTSLASALAKSVGGTFKRVQFTPDILPSDITGFSMYNKKTGEFEYRSGAVMCQFLLADEINRASAKTQSSLLEVMQENQVTVDGETYQVPTPFMVIATQNPVEYVGTYELPEAQLDRFFMRISLGYPSPAEERNMLLLHAGEEPMAKLRPVASVEEILGIQKLVPQVHTDPRLLDYIVTLISRTRENPHVELGASPRATIALHRAAQARALCGGRGFVQPDDIQQMFLPVVSHRLVMKREAKLKNATPHSVLQEILHTTPVPGMGR